MRDHNRIGETLSRLAMIWQNYPDLRLGQLILNVISENELYYVEDESLVEKLEKYYD